MRQHWPIGVIPLLLVAGCLGPTPNPDIDDGEVPPPTVDFRHLEAPGAEVLDTPDTRSFLWEGTTVASVDAVGANEFVQSGEPAHEFEIDASVGYIEGRIEHEGGSDALLLSIRDDQGRIACAVIAPGSGDYCTALVPRGQTEEVLYVATVSGTTGGLVPSAHEGDVPYQVNVTLHPPHHIPVVDVDAGLDTRTLFEAIDTGFPGGEPTLGLNSHGTIFVVESATTLRSDDDGRTWEDVTPPLTTTTLDPMLYVDPWTDRIFTDHLYVGCSYLSWSDDGGENWVTNPAACGTPANDHQKVAVGAHFAPTPLFDGIVYYSYASFGEGIWVSRSLDGGLTWTSTLAMTEAQGFPYRTGGPVAADREGNVYVPAYLRDGGFGVTVSNDHGATFTPMRAGEGSGGGEGIDPGIAIDTAGNAYAAYWGPEGVHVVATTDQGASWSEPVIVSPPQLQSFVLAAATAGDEGRVAVAYLATAESDRGPNRADGFARWHLYVSITENALAPDPVWNTTRATPADDPVQVGTICTGGISCFGGNRNLLDFIDVEAGPDGRVYVAYTDGCDRCELPQTSRDDAGFVAVQVEGPRLFVDEAPWAAQKPT